MANSFFAAISGSQAVCIRQNEAGRVREVMPKVAGELGRHQTRFLRYDLLTFTPGVSGSLGVPWRKLLIDSSGIQHTLPFAKVRETALDKRKPCLQGGLSF